MADSDGTIPSSCFSLAVSNSAPATSRLLADAPIKAWKGNLLYEMNVHAVGGPPDWLMPTNADLSHAMWLPNPH